MDIAHHAAILLIALGVDAVVGDPDWLWRRLAHPVVVIGRAIGLLDKRLNRLDLDEGERRRRGVLTLALVVTAAAAVGWLLAWTFASIPYGFLIEGVIAATLIAQRSLYNHVAAVRDAFAAAGLPLRGPPPASGLIQTPELFVGPPLEP
ncbi:MAG: cobalamin biosynthesis protein, partial [Hansschlegelia sp.]